MQTPALSQELAEDLRVDPERYRGLHGNAILTRFPIQSARIERLSECYDWYGEEVRSISAIEQSKRWAANKAFSERIVREVRRGGRMSLIVELEVPGVPESLTVVSTHLEDRAKSSCRRQQMGEIVRQVRSIPGLLLIGGDLNTSGTDGTPTSLGYEIKKRISDPHFWIKQGIQWFTPLGIPFYIGGPLNFWKNFHDPTAINIPVFGRSTCPTTTRSRSNWSGHLLSPTNNGCLFPDGLHQTDPLILRTGVLLRHSSSDEAEIRRWLFGAWQHIGHSIGSRPRREHKRR